jgi:integrase
MAEHSVIMTQGGALEVGQAGTNPALVYLASLQPTGRRSMQSTLAKVAELAGGFTIDSMPWSMLQYEHVVAIRTKLSELYSPATVNKYLCALRGVMRAAWQLGQLSGETYQKMASVKGITASTLPAGRGLSPGEVQGLMWACANDPTPTGARDAAIIALAYGGGLRRAELAALDRASVTEDPTGELTIKVQGKRNKERLVYLDGGAAGALLDWLAIRGDEPGALFWSGRRGGHLIKGQRISGQAIGDVLTKRAELAAIKPCTPHDLRRSFVSDLLDAGVDISTVANMAGHESIQTTRRYDRRGEQAKKRAAKALHVPYRRRMI